MLQIDPALANIDNTMVNTILTKYVFTRGWKTGDNIRIPRRKDIEPDIDDTGYRWGILNEDAAASVADGGKRAPRARATAAAGDMAVSPRSAKEWRKTGTKVWYGFRNSGSDFEL